MTKYILHTGDSETWLVEAESPELAEEVLEEHYHEEREYDTTIFYEGRLSSFVGEADMNGAVMLTD